MEKRQALASFGALSQETRLEIVRMLVIAGPTGMHAGAIAEKIGTSPSNISFHLKELDRAGLIGQQRESRSIIYSAKYDALSDLVRFLMEDCCAGHPKICKPAATVTACGGPSNKEGAIGDPQGTTSLSLQSISGNDADLRIALTAAALPTDDLTEDGRHFFRIARGTDTLGFGGYELHDGDALLRSLVILPDHRGKGLGDLATRLLLESAHSAGARRAYLLTTSAASFFERLGFEKIDRSAAPTAILQTRQATSVCPASAALLAKPLTPGADANVGKKSEDLNA